MVEPTLLNVAIFAAATLSNLALHINPFRASKFPSLLFCLYQASKVVIALILAGYVKHLGHHYWGWILSDLAFAMATGPAFLVYPVAQKKSDLGIWFEGKMNDFADGAFAGVFIAAVALLVGLWSDSPAVSVILTGTLAVPLTLGKVATAYVNLRAEQPLMAHIALKIVAIRLGIFLPAFALLIGLFVGLVPQLTYKPSYGEQALAFFVGGLLSFL